MQAICDSVHAALQGDSQPQWDSTLRNPTGQQAAWSYLLPAKLQQGSLGVPSCLPGRHELRPGDRIFVPPTTPPKSSRPNTHRLTVPAARIASTVNSYTALEIVQVQESYLQ